MKKTIFTAILAVFFSNFNAQVGINSTDPKATLQVVGEPSNSTKFDGILAPRITGELLRAKAYAVDQNGTIIYVTTADTAPAGQTIDVTSEGYYYYSSASDKWVKMGAKTQTNDWHTTGNTDAEISTATETLGTTPVSSNYLGTAGTTDNLVLVTGAKTRGVLDTTGTLTGGGTDGNSYFMWGSQNTASVFSNPNFTYNNAIIVGYKNALVNSNIIPATGASAAVILGKENTVNYNGVAIGYNNTTSNGLVLGNNNITSSGVVLGSGNTTSSGQNVFGNAFKSTLHTGLLGGTNVYANTYHYFATNDGAGTVVQQSKIGVNVAPTATQDSDIKVSKAVQIVATVDATITCNTTNEGAIRYILNAGSMVGTFQGCRRSAASTFGWAQLNN